MIVRVFLQYGKEAWVHCDRIVWLNPDDFESRRMRLLGRGGEMCGEFKDEAMMGWFIHTDHMPVDLETDDE